MSNDPVFQRELAELKILAIDTFDSESMAERWLNSPNFVLGTSPISYAQTTSNIEEVKKILGAISYGGVV